jgi:type IV pilus assembly protein PilC
MPVYTFTGKDAKGSKVSGERSADNKGAMAALLRKERITVTLIKEKGKEFAVPKAAKGSVAAKDLAIFFKQFSVMIDAGLPLVQCMEILGANQENKFFMKVIADVRASVEGGATLANSLRLYPKVFDDLVVNMIDAGEAGGILDTILQRLAGYVEKAVKLKAAVKSALIYPISICSIAGLVVFALMRWVVPIFGNLFASMDVELPLPTKITVGISNFVQSFGWLLIPIGIGAYFAFQNIYSTPKGKLAIDGFMLKVPVIGSILRKIAVARFTRTLGTLITSGVPLLESMSITARTSGNAVIEGAIMKVRKAIEEGRNMTDPLRESGIFPNMVTQMIGVGEQTGAMDAMLSKIADFYEDEVDTAVKDMLTLLEPMIMAGLGVVIGGVVISLYMPLFSLIGKLAG